MFSKRLEKTVKGLHQLKNRRSEQAFFFEGNKMALDAFSEQKLEIIYVFALPIWIEKNIHRWASLAEKGIKVSDREMKKISALQNPTEVLIVAKKPPLSDSFVFARKGLAGIYLEGIQNPGNMGTILRIADWFGIQHIIASPDSVDFYNPKVIQASMSSIFRLNLQIADLDLLTQKKGDFKLWATALTGVPIQQVDKTADHVLLMIGNEGKGLSQKALALADATITIPGHPDSHTESLNAAVAAGIICSYFDSSLG